MRNGPGDRAPAAIFDFNQNAAVWPVSGTGLEACKRGGQSIEMISHGGMLTAV